MLNKDKPVKFSIDENLCTSCGQCAKVCSGYLVHNGDNVVVNKDSHFGCIQCGLCMITCPHNAINIEAKGLSKDKIFKLNTNLPDYDMVNNLLKKRRSIRKYKRQELSKDLIDKIIDSASTAPISIPPTEIKVVVINGYDKVNYFKDQVYKGFEGMLKFFNPLVLMLFRPIMGKIQHSIMKEFIIPYAKMTLKSRDKGEDILFYNAPAVIIFAGSEFSDKEDAILASAFANIGAEALGLGTCIIGSIAPILERNKKLSLEYDLKPGDKIYTGFIVGYPDVKYTKGIHREFLDVNYV